MNIFIQLIVLFVPILGNHYAKCQPGIFMLSDLEDGTNGFVYGPIDKGMVTSAGDVNGDGIQDLIVGAVGAGTIYVLFGSSDRTLDKVTNSYIDLNRLDGKTGFIIEDIEILRNDSSWFTLDSGGDVNGDNVDDIVIGSPQAKSGTGHVHVVFGSNTSWPSSLRPSDLNGTNGFTINGVAGEDLFTGWAVSSGGDLNNDGFDDIVLGTFADWGKNGTQGVGRVYVLWGSTNPMPSQFDLTANPNGTSDFTVINGIVESGIQGYSVSSDGDVNGDGVDDLVIRRAIGNMGQVYIIFGSTVLRSLPSHVADLNGSNGFVLNFEDDRTQNVFRAIGSAPPLATDGDFNHDGIDDLIIGIPKANPNGTEFAGQVHVVFGSKTTWPSSSNLTDHLNGANGFTLTGAKEDNFAGYSISCGGDLNGDEIDDLVVGAGEISKDPFAAAYIVFGTNGTWESSFNLSQLDGTNGYTLISTTNNLPGWSVSSKGDLNGDGLNDVVIGVKYSSWMGDRNQYYSYVLYGAAPTPSPTTSPSEMPSTTSIPSTTPSSSPTESPSESPTASPTTSESPTESPSSLPTSRPSETSSPSMIPSASPSATPGHYYLADLDGVNGVTYSEHEANDRAGLVVSSGGDINGDGIDDFFVSAPYADADGASNLGKVYVIFGSNSTGTDMAQSHTHDLEELANGIDGFVMHGINERECRSLSLASGGDVNGDGVDDLVIGAPFAAANGTQAVKGRVFVVFGSRKAPWTPSSFSLGDLNGTNGFILNGFGEGDEYGSLYTGYSVSCNGDIDGDGVHDLVVGAPLSSTNGLYVSGRVYVFWGSTEPVPSPFDLDTDVTTGTSKLLVIDGIEETSILGVRLSTGGDLNGDGIHDLVIPAPNTFSDQVYIVFGSKSLSQTSSPSFDLRLLNGTNGLAINGGEKMKYPGGFPVASSGDLNGDGLADLVIGAYEADPHGTRNAGMVFVVFGSSTSWSSPFNLYDLDGTNGFAVNGIKDQDGAGWSVSSDGDINGDDIDDLVIAAPSADPGGRSRSGTVYILYGSNATWGQEFNLSNLDESNGFVLNGFKENDQIGTSVSSAGDINGDQIDDLVIGKGKEWGIRNEFPGQTYVVYGFAPPPPPSPTKTPTTPFPVPPTSFPSPSPSNSLPTSPTESPIDSPTAITTEPPSTTLPTTSSPTTLPTVSPSVLSTPAPTERAMDLDSLVQAIGAASGDPTNRSTILVDPQVLDFDEPGADSVQSIGLNLTDRYFDIYCADYTATNKCTFKRSNSSGRFFFGIEPLDVSFTGFRFENGRRVRDFQFDDIIPADSVSGGAFLFLGGQPVDNVFSTKSEVRFIDCDYVNNTSYGDGGAVTVSTESASDWNVAFSGCDFDSNFALYYGGGLSAVAGGDGKIALNITESLFTGNSARSVRETGDIDAAYNIDFSCTSTSTNDVLVSDLNDSPTGESCIAPSPSP